MDKVTTIDDIVKAAGVGKGTVDRVLHNRGRVSEETRNKVLRCIEDLNYRPNTAARMLAKKGTYRIAVCFHDKEIDFWTQVKEGVRKASEQYAALGVTVEMFILPQVDVPRQLEVIRKVIDEQYDGLAIVPYSSPLIVDSINQAIEAGVEVITFNNREEKINACYVGSNGVQSGRVAGRLMSLQAGQNAKYMIICAHSRAMIQVDERAMGFQDILSAMRPDMECVGCHIFDENYQTIFDFVVRTLQTQDVNAIYATSECLSAVGRAVHSIGYDKKVTVVGHDLTPPIVELIRMGCIDSSVGQDPERQGYSSVDQICRKLLAGDSMRDEYTKMSIAIAENIDYL